MAYKAEGKIEKIFDTEQKTSSFSAREFVIEVADGQYPQMIKFQLVQDKCNLVDEYAEGDMIEVDFDLRGREWNGKYFTNLHAWRISRAGEDGGQGGGQGGDQQGSNQGGNQGNAQPQQSNKPAASTAASGNDFDDDIPF